MMIVVRVCLVISLSATCLSQNQKRTQTSMDHDHEKKTQSIINLHGVNVQAEGDGTSFVQVDLTEKTLGQRSVIATTNDANSSRTLLNTRSVPSNLYSKKYPCYVWLYDDDECKGKYSTFQTETTKSWTKEVQGKNWGSLNTGGECQSIVLYDEDDWKDGDHITMGESDLIYHYSAYSQKRYSKYVKSASHPDQMKHPACYKFPDDLEDDLNALAVRAVLCQKCKDFFYNDGCNTKSVGTCKKHTECNETQTIEAKGDMTKDQKCQQCATCDPKKQNLINCDPNREVKSECEDRMNCADTSHGFVHHGEEITKKTNPYAKSCPVDAPRVVADNYCKEKKCSVSADRSICCRPNICTCKDGAPKSAAECQEDDNEECKTCDPGYHLEQEGKKQFCKLDTCQCPNGKGTTGTGKGATFCAEHGKKDCKWCKPGYHPNVTFGIGPQVCIANKCTCKGGTPTTLDDCTHDDPIQQDCAKCHPGYDKKPTPGTPDQKPTHFCEAKTCPEPTFDTLTTEQKKYVDTSRCAAEIKTGGDCTVECKKGWTGTGMLWKCDGTKLDGKYPSCKAQTCNNVTATQIDEKMITWNCENKSTTDTCQVACKTGYEALDGDTTITLICTHKGWEPTNNKNVKCTPKKCPAVADNDITNGKAGECNKETATGASCNINCSDGYVQTGTHRCKLGDWYEKATCTEEPCTITNPPAHGKLGECKDELPSKKECAFDCFNGFKAVKSKCDKGDVTMGSCAPELPCNLRYGYKCESKFGFWTDEKKYLTYQGCEEYCSLQYGKNDKKGHIKGCELSGVGPIRGDDATSGDTGKWCFAHQRVICSMTKTNSRNAAHRCGVE